MKILFARRRGALALSLLGVLALPACEHYEYAYKPQPEAQMRTAALPASLPVSAPVSGEPNPCAESFNHALDRLVMAMETSTAQSVQVTAAVSQQAE